MVDLPSRLVTFTYRAAYVTLIPSIPLVQYIYSGTCERKMDEESPGGLREGWLIEFLWVQGFMMQYVGAWNDGKVGSMVYST